jgi:integral membrane protein
VAVEHAVLTRYRVMAYVTAVLLIVLVFVGVPLQVAGHPGVATVVGTLHGFLYLVYLFVAFQLTRTLHVPIGRTLLVLVAGTVPFGAIIAERRLTSLYSRLERQARRAAAPEAGTESAGPAQQGV